MWIAAKREDQRETDREIYFAWVIFLLISMHQLKLTSKRQVTIPKEVCDALGVGPGDVIEMEPGIVDGKRIYILRSKVMARPWLGCLKGNVRKVDDHSMEAVRKSIAIGRERADDWNAD